MKKITRKIEAEDSFFNHIMKSWHHERKIPEGVVMVIPRPGGKILLMTKEFYPKGAFRLPSGGMHKGETPEEAFSRELREETGFSLPIVRKLAEIDTEVVSEGRSTGYKMHVFLTPETSSTICTEDESEQITEFKEIPIDDLMKVAEELRSLPAPWRGWGEFWTAAHEVTHRVLSTEDS